MSDLLIVALVLGPTVLPALALAYCRRWPSRPADRYRGTRVEWPRVPARMHPRFERLPR